MFSAAGVYSSRLMATYALLLAGAVLLQVQHALSAYHYLDTKNMYRMDWTYTTTDITISLTVNSSGWIGLGFSPNGGMVGSDIVIIYALSNGTFIIQDHYATAQTLPALDSQQDYKLLSSRKTNGQIQATFTRLLDTCDANDAVIKPYTTKVIFAYGALDASGQPAYHTATQRGAKSMYLLNAEPPATNDTGIFYIDTRPPNISVPDAHTTYWCSLVQLPNMTSKSHIIEMTPVIPIENLDIVHHILVYTCRTVNLSYTSFDLLKGENGGNMKSCNALLGMWAFGGESFRLPDNVGIPIGNTTAPQYVLIQTHYSNMNREAGRIDSSYLRFVATRNLRPNDGGILQTGVVPGILVPPLQSQVVVAGYCTERCVKTFPASGINVFGVQLHSHLLGRRLLLRHFRPSENRQLPVIADDPFYDFDYQQIRNLETNRIILPGDILQTICAMSSASRNVTTQGGTATDQEMCLSFIFYYPRIDLFNCFTIPMFVYDATDRIYGLMNRNISNFDWFNGLNHGLENVNWSAPLLSQIQSRYVTGALVDGCETTQDSYNITILPAIVSAGLPSAVGANQSCVAVSTTTSTLSKASTSAVGAIQYGAAVSTTASKLSNADKLKSEIAFLWITVVLCFLVAF